MRFSFFPVFIPVLLLLICGCGSSAEKVEVPWPSWIFTHWVWEDESTQESALQLVKEYLDRDIPAGAVIIDSPWETHYNTFVFDPDLYPDPSAMVHEFHSMGVKVIMWISSMINTDSPDYAYALSRGYFLQRESDSGAVVIEWWKGKGSLLDYFNPDALEWWHSQMEKVLELDIDGWKCDGTDFYAWLAPYSPGAGRYISRREYSDAYYRDFYEYTRRRLGRDRIITARPVDNYGTGYGEDLAVFAPRDVNWAGWVGDQDPTFEGLEAALNNMYYSSRKGYLAFGSDIGGYRVDSAYAPLGRSKELFIRWSQLGAFSPVMENGGGGEHRPWMFDEETLAIYRFYTKMRYAILGYIESEAKKSWKKGLSLMRFFHMKDYAFYLGNDIIVYPVYENVNRRFVKMPPEGQWLYIFNLNGKKYSAGMTDVIPLTLWEYPVFVRKNSNVHHIIEQYVNGNFK